VSLLERLRDLAGDLQGLADLQRSAGQQLPEGLARDELQDEEAMAVTLLEAVDGRDVGVVQRAEDSRLALEARHAVGIAGYRLGQDLECDLSGETGVAGPIDLAHSSAPQCGKDLELAQARPRPRRPCRPLSGDG
jgi:hypothetical protein